MRDPAPDTIATSPEKWNAFGTDILCLLQIKIGNSCVFRSAQLCSERLRDQICPDICGVRARCNAALIGEPLRCFMDRQRATSEDAQV